MAETGGFVRYQYLMVALESDVECFLLSLSDMLGRIVIRPSHQAEAGEGLILLKRCYRLNHLFDFRHAILADQFDNIAVQFVTILAGHLFLVYNRHRRLAAGSALFDAVFNLDVQLWKFFFQAPQCFAFAFVVFAKTYFHSIHPIPANG